MCGPSGHLLSLRPKRHLGIRINTAAKKKAMLTLGGGDDASENGTSVAGAGATAPGAAFEKFSFSVDLARVFYL